MFHNRLILLIQTGIALLTSVALVAAQATCDVDVNDVISQVDTVCSSIEDNQVCYGNFEVNAIIQDNAPTQTFASQGDVADVAYLQSLFLSALDPQAETWGIAQMRLVTSSPTGTQDVNLLLFGDVEIVNAVENNLTFDVIVGEFAANIRNVPRSNSIVLESLASGTVLETVGRLEDGTWLRVSLEDGRVGWVSTSLVSQINETDNFDDLAIQDGSSPYFGSMQAFYFTEGGGSECGNVMADGLLIQTPEGTARVTLLINEVSIELIPRQNGSTILVTGNAVDGMTVSVIDGEAVVASNGSSFYLDATQQTTIPLDENLSASGAPSLPISYDVETIAGLPILPIVRDPSLPIISNSEINSGNTTNGNGSANGNGNGNANGRDNGRGNGNANGNSNGN